MGATLTKILFTVGTTLLTEKVLINLLLILASWLAKKTTTDLDDNLVVALREGLEKKNGVAQSNVYDNVKAKLPSSH